MIEPCNRHLYRWNRSLKFWIVLDGLIDGHHSGRRPPYDFDRWRLAVMFYCNIYTFISSHQTLSLTKPPFFFSLSLLKSNKLYRHQLPSQLCRHQLPSQLCRHQLPSVHPSHHPHLTCRYTWDVSASLQSHVVRVAKVLDVARVERDLVRLFFLFRFHCTFSHTCCVCTTLLSIRTIVIHLSHPKSSFTLYTPYLFNNI